MLVMQSLDDTIVALSTPAGSSPRAIVRLSGPDAFAILDGLLSTSQVPSEIGNRQSAIGNRLQALPPYSATDAHLRLHLGGPAIPATLYLMRAPRSYTRQHVAEVHTIGSPPLLRMLLDAFVARGARVAEPGEFTRRAFLAGRIDLAQAEAVLAVIQAASVGEHRAAARALQGLASRRIHELHDRLVSLRSLVEASIDFAEHDIELASPADVLAGIEDALAIVADALRNADAGALPPEGIRVALCGPPNAGKSSLFNALLGRPRAIITPIPGTTRDAVAEPLILDAILFLLYDTAGLATPLPIADCQLPISEIGNRKSEIGNQEAIAAEAIARAWGVIAGTHIALVVLDASQPLTDAARRLWRDIQAPHKLLLLNKSDLPPAITMVHGVAEALAMDREPAPALKPDTGCLAPLPSAVCRLSSDEHASRVTRQSLRTSALTGAGLPELRAALVALVRSGRVEASPSDLLLNARHREALRNAREALDRAAQAIGEGLGEEFVAADLRTAHDALGAITGQVAPDDLLDRIFAQFCIGK
ncbi:MAG: tRNA modification GTPase [Planctomycetes bacterium]|nr:tRNA modification GTPase [Planctomycetota bacterium]